MKTSVPADGVPVEARRRLLELEEEYVRCLAESATDPALRAAAVHRLAELSNETRSLQNAGDFPETPSRCGLILSSAAVCSALTFWIMARLSGGRVYLRRNPVGWLLKSILSPLVFAGGFPEFV
jgi:hypothetical protein